MTEGISYKKCTYNEEERKMREKDCRIYRIRQERIKKLAEEKTEENLWQTIIAFQEYPFKTMTGLPFYYNLNFQPEIALKASQAEKLHVIGTLNLCFSHTHIMFFRKFKSCL